MQIEGAATYRFMESMAHEYGSLGVQLPTDAGSAGGFSGVTVEHYQRPWHRYGKERWWARCGMNGTQRRF